MIFFVVFETLYCYNVDRIGSGIMAKKKCSIEIKNIKEGNLFVNEDKLKSVVFDMEKQLGVLEKSLLDISVSVNKLVNQKVIKGSQVDSYKSLSNKTKAQSIAAQKLRNSLTLDYEKDMQVYSVQRLDERIAELEEKIATLEEE